MPLLEVFNRQRQKPVNLFEFRIFAELAIEQVAKMRTAAIWPDEINVVFVSDARITRIHRDYMSVDGPTDVITFRHGEIVISVETADRQASKFSTSFDYELRLYFVHGLLHLAGFDDVTAAGFDKMVQLQKRIVRSCQLSVVGCQPEWDRRSSQAI